jgi:uncharacterized protein (DUF1499 family)
MVVWLVLTAVVVFIGYVRLAPSDPARWHVDPGHAIDYGGLTSFPPGPDSVISVPGGARAMYSVLGGTAEQALHQLDEIATATPRTVRLAGSPEEGRITWVTRSAVFGFPDYTTAEARPMDGMVNIDLFARQRFGRGDLGVNAERLRAWLSLVAAP